MRRVANRNAGKAKVGWAAVTQYCRVAYDPLWRGIGLQNSEGRRLAETRIKQSYPKWTNVTVRNSKLQPYN